MNPFIDLHCHTTLSDGEYSPDEVCGRAQAGGVGTLAITDHNFNNPDLDALRTRHPGLHILRGSEISCVYETAAGDPVEIHVIALNYDPDAEALRRVLAQNQPDRRGYVNAILEKLAAHSISLGSYDDLAAMRPNTHHVGRMQIARAMLAKGYVSSVDEAFDRYIGSFGQRLAYVENPLCYASLSDTVAAIRAAKGIPILCHLFYYRLDEAEQHRLLAAFQQAAGPCAGMEVLYGRYTPEQRAVLAGLAQQYHLLPSAGSDFHGLQDGNSLGSGFEHHFPAGIYEALAARQLEYYGMIHD